MSDKRATNNQFKALQDKILKQKASITKDVGAGGCTDFSNYQFKVRLIHGLALAERELLDLDSKVDDDY